MPYDTRVVDLEVRIARWACEQVIRLLINDLASGMSSKSYKRSGCNSASPMKKLVDCDL